MKKNLNVIQINGFRGLFLVIMAACCLAAGFIVFPGKVLMHIWNFIAASVENMPVIGVIQGILLWAILVVSYFIFRKNKLIVCFKAPQGLSEEELKSVFADIKKNSQEDKLIQAMIKARETELKLKSNEETENSNLEK